MPQTGKLNALMCTAAPSSGTQTCWPTKRAALRQGLERAVEIDVAVRQLPRALAREHEHRADAAVDVDPGIALGRAGRVRERVELGLEVEQALAERAQHRRALVEGHRAQRRAADFARVTERGAEIEALARGFRHHCAGAGIAQDGRTAPAALPLAAQVTLQAHRVFSSSSLQPAARAACQAANVAPSAASLASRLAGTQ